ncbi:MAG: ATP-binding protein [Nitrospirota bacterium]
MVEIFENRFEITNPGGLVKGLTPENFGKISMLRNPGIANLFQRIDYIEKMGTGIERIRLALKKAKLPQVIYELMPFFVKAVFPKAIEDLEITTQETKETTQETILQLIRVNPYVTREELAGNIGITTGGIKYHMEKLRKEGKLRHSGPTKKGKWEVLHGDKESKS